MKKSSSHHNLALNGRFLGIALIMLLVGQVTQAQTCQDLKKKLDELTSERDQDNQDLREPGLPVVAKSQLQEKIKQLDQQIAATRLQMQQLQCTPPSLAPPNGGFDLVANPHYPLADDNGLPDNPQFRWQAYALSTPGADGLLLPDVYDLSCGPYAWEVPCVSTPTAAENGKLCSLWGHDGHHNWTPATYDGEIYWEQHSPPSEDDDYNFRLVPTPALKGNIGPGLTATSYRIYPQTGELDSPRACCPAHRETEIGPFGGGPAEAGPALPSIGLEFNASETVRHFQTPWWSELETAVEEEDVARNLYDLCGTPGEACSAFPLPPLPLLPPQCLSGGSSEGCANALFTRWQQKRANVFFMVYGKYAIVTGLFGLDCAHVCYPELHPVYAMAIRARDIRVGDNNSAGEVWAMFVRRWGDEGFCSQHSQFLENLPNNTYTFRIPWKEGATGVQVIQSDFFSRNGQAYQPAVRIVGPGPLGRPTPNQGVYVSFTLPAPNESDSNERVHGELHLSWSLGPSGSVVAVSPVAPAAVTSSHRITGVFAPGVLITAPTASQPEESSPEVGFRQLLSKMTPDQRRIFSSKFSPTPISTKDSAPLRAGPPSVARPSSGPPRVRAVINPRKQAEDQQRLDALHAVYGPNIPWPRPSPGVSRPPTGRPNER